MDQIKRKNEKWMEEEKIGVLRTSKRRNEKIKKVCLIVYCEFFGYCLIM